jgi:hypothetical protein
MPIAKTVSTIRAAIMGTSARWALRARQASFHRGDLRFAPKAATISLRISRSAIRRSEGAQ